MYKLIYLQSAMMSHVVNMQPIIPKMCIHINSHTLLLTEESYANSSWQNEKCMWSYNESWDHFKLNLREILR